MSAHVTPLRIAEDSAATPPLRPREIDAPRIEHAVREILAAIGEDPDRDGLQETPARVARAYREIFAGIGSDPVQHLGRVFRHDTDGDDLVVVRNIEIFSVCEHHLLPFTGSAHVIYLPRDGHVVGLSKIARTVEVFARRPQMQERLTAQIADALVEHLGARGVAVVVRGEHMCMKMRGVGKQRADMVTTALRGLLRTDATLRGEALDLLRQPADG